MATSTQAVSQHQNASPLALWHLLSLDAPTVAALWVWFIARSAHLRLTLTPAVAMALAVWMLYAADRLLDTRELDRPYPAANVDLELRHFFHHHYRCRFLAGIAAAASALTAVLHLLDAAAIRLYLVEAGLLFMWFVILHATSGADRLPKEIAVGVFFSAAVFIPTIARQPELRSTLLPAAILFAATCSLNCIFLYAWEHDLAVGTSGGARVQRVHFTTRRAIPRLRMLSAAVAAAGAAITWLDTGPAGCVAIACVLSVMLLLLLHRNRQRLSPVNLRAAADVALLTPLLLLPFLS